MSAHDFADLHRHVGHQIECVTYGDPPVNVALECEDCCEVLMDFDVPAVRSDKAILTDLREHIMADPDVYPRGAEEALARVLERLGDDS